MRSEIRRALLIGVAFAVLLNSVKWVFDYYLSGSLPELSMWFWVLWPLLGAFLLGAVPAYLFLRYHVILPLVISTLVSGVIAILSVQQELAQLRSESAWALAGTHLFYYLIFGAVPLVIVLLVVGIIEHRLSDPEPDDVPA